MKQYLACMHMHTAFKYLNLVNDMMAKTFLKICLLITNFDHENGKAYLTKVFVLFSF